MSRIIFAAVLAATAACAFPAAANAAIMSAGDRPLIVAGDPNGTPADSPDLRVDPNTSASPYSGVVSINTQFDGKSFICSGAMISRTHVLTAAHCVDSNNQGQTIDLAKPGNSVRAVFNASASPGDPGQAVISALKVTMHPDYDGFGICPAGVPGVCVNDDIAIIELAQPAPDAAKIYRIHDGYVDEGATFTLVGYGPSGDGIDGYTVEPDFRVKRSGQNVYDLTDLDDEQGFAGTPEVWYSDFDGNGEDYFCEIGLVCGASLGNGIETLLGGGDSGGPSFISFGGELRLVGNNTFGGTPEGNVEGSFGDFSGGMLLRAYYRFILDNSDAVPEPGAVSIAVLGLLGLGLMRRCRKA